MTGILYVMAGGWTKGRLCSIEGCGAKHYGKDLCAMHYSRLRRTGTTDDPDWREPPIDRFTRMVSVDPDGCWRWTGTVNPKGYGMFDPGLRREGGPKMMSSHRWSYQYHICPVPDGMTLDHLCRVRHCVNPNHLEPVTNRENMRRSPLAPEHRTHCPRGHPYDEANTYVYKGRRSCRICGARSKAEWEARKRSRQS